MPTYFDPVGTGRLKPGLKQGVAAAALNVQLLALLLPATGRTLFAAALTSVPTGNKVSASNPAVSASAPGGVPLEYTA